LLVPRLEGELVVLEPLSHEHSAGMFELWSRQEVWLYSGPATDVTGGAIELPAPSRAESDKILEFWLGRAEEGTGFRWAVLLEQLFIGAAGFNSIGSCSEYAYHLHPEYWGRGLMLEASRLALSWLSSRDGCVAADAFIEPANLRSVALAERLGFVRTGEHMHGTDRYVLQLV
jgi:RimJ/RimL family protein N-acetyltransferase